MNIITNIIISLFFITLIHEFSHLIAAKMCKVGVNIYSIGFGKKLFGFKFHNTEYRISLIPFGGYCKLEGETKFSKSPTAFTNKRYSVKVFIALAGCIVNIVIGLIVLYFIKSLYLFGYFSIVLGLTNLIPFPALDGSYPFLFLLEKVFGKEKGLKIINKIAKYGFRFLMTLQIIIVVLLLIYKFLLILNGY